MPYKTDVCPYCEKSYPHVGPTGCEPVSREEIRERMRKAREVLDEGGDSRPAGGLEPGGIAWI